MSVLGKAAQAIDCLCRAGEPVRLGTASSELGLPKSSTHRLLSELAELGIVRRSDDGRYSLGHRLLYWGTRAANSFDLKAIAEPSMRRLRDEIGESVHLHVTTGGARVCIAVAEGPHSLRPAVTLGLPLPLGTGAAGKLLLAFADDETRATVDGPPPEELERIRTEHWATSVGEVEEGLSVAGTTVRGSGGTVVGALTVPGLSARLTPQRLEELRGPLTSCAAEISDLIQRG